MFLNLIKTQQLRRLVRFYQQNQLWAPLPVIQALSCSSVTVMLPAICRFSANELTTRRKGVEQPDYKCNRHYMTAATNRMTAAGTENIEIAVPDQPNGTCESMEDLEAEASNFSLKALLYDVKKDHIMRKLNSSLNAEQLLETMQLYRGAVDHRHFVQSVILLWSYHVGQGQVSPKDGAKNELLQYVLSNLRPYICDMCITEQSVCYLYLRKLGVPNTEAVTQELLAQSLQEVATTNAQIPLPALSRLAVGINTDRDFHIPSVCDKFLPQVVKHMETCNNEEDARLLSICLLNLQVLVTADILDSFKRLLQRLLKRRVLNEHTSPRVMVKLLQFLNLSHWSQRNSLLIRNFLLELGPNASQLSDNDLKSVCRIFQYHLEPAAVVKPLTEATKTLLQRDATPDVLAAFMPFAEPHRREPLMALLKRLLFSNDSWQAANASRNFFTIIRALKISEAKVCDAYWAHILHRLDACPEDETQLRFMRHCNRYMNFNNNLGGTYRFVPLEKKLSRMAMHAIEDDIAGRIPSKFARLAAFVLAYGHTPFSWKKFPNTILSKIISMSGQFSISDCFQISRGMQIAMELRFRHNVPSLLGMQLATIDSILVDCVERHLDTKEGLTVNELNTTLRIFGNRKSLKNKVIYQEALNRYKEADYSDLNSRTIREMALNFNMSGFVVPKALEAMFNYIEHNHEHVIGDTVEKVLTCAYNLGYTPQSPNVLEYAALILKRDFQHMSGLSIVQACLTLCYYKTIPEDLIDMVFCVKFIQRIEEEIHLCYSKATYPERVLNLVMQLNRTVCLDFPEANVPWFHQNYLEAQLSKKLMLPGLFTEDVKKFLEAVVKDETYFRCNHTTPYGYQIDFVIHFDQNRKPIAAPVETTMLDRITKVAILLLRLDSFCENDPTALRGPEYLKMKHLEMMGYKVLHINEHDWNSKYMNAPGAKTNYLKCLLQITN